MCCSGLLLSIAAGVSGQRRFPAALFGAFQQLPAPARSADQLAVFPPRFAMRRCSSSFLTASCPRTSPTSPLNLVANCAIPMCAELQLIFLYRFLSENLTYISTMLAMRPPPLELGPSTGANLPSEPAEAATAPAAAGTPSAAGGAAPGGGSGAAGGAASTQAAVQAATPTAQAPVQPFVLLMDVRASAPSIRLPRSSGGWWVVLAGGWWLRLGQPKYSFSFASDPPQCTSALERGTACCTIHHLHATPAAHSYGADSMDAIEADLGQLTLQTASIVPQVWFHSAFAGTPGSASSSCRFRSVRPCLGSKSTACTCLL